MNTYKLIAAFLIFASAAPSVVAGESEDKIFSITSGIKARYLSDSGDLKLAALDIESRVGDLFGSPTKCSRRRAGDLSRAFRGVLDATAKVNAKAIFSAAKHLDLQAHKRSSMYTRCWNHMVGQTKVLGEVADIAGQVIAVGAAAGW
jgi:hypothetical protein